MQRFRYTAVNLHKHKIKGTFIARDPEDLAQQLSKQGLYLLRARVQTDAPPLLGVGRVSLQELTVFCRQFSLMLNTGIPILECLELLCFRQQSRHFRVVLQQVYEDVKGGSLLSEALTNRKDAFPPFFRSMVSVGEACGRLDAVMVSLTDYYERYIRQRQKIRGAMAYPGMLAVLTVGILILMLTWVVPTFRSAMQDMQVDVTGMTKIVYDTSDFVLENWRSLLAAVVGACMVGAMLSFAEPARYAWDAILLKIPWIGKTQHNLQAARFSRALGLLLASGMDLNTAMDAVEIVLSNRAMKCRFSYAAQSIRQGMSLTVAFETYRLFPQAMTQMVAIGEKTAALDTVLLRCGTFLDEQVEQALQSFAAKIQPVMLMALGGIIGVLFLAMYAPLLSIMGSL